MPVVRTAETKDEAYHSSPVSKKWTTSPGRAGASSICHRPTLWGDGKWPLFQLDKLFPDHQATQDGFIPFRPHTPPTRVGNSIARGETDGYYIDQQLASVPDTPTTATSDTPTSPSEITRATTPEESSQDRFDEDVMIYYNSLESSLLSQFAGSSTDDNDRTSTYSVAPDFLGFSPSPESTNLTIPMEDEHSWLSGPNAPTIGTWPNFAAVKDVGNWPWGGFTYQPEPIVEYKEPEDMVLDYELEGIQELMREELTEIIANEAIRAGRKEMERQKKEARKARRRARKTRVTRDVDDRPSTTAFDNQAVRGRTIYNP